jgi:hypothetical protein
LNSFISLGIGSPASVQAFIMFGLAQGEAPAIVLVPPYQLTGIDAAASSLAALDAEAPILAGVAAVAPSLGLTASRPSFG